MLTFKYFCISCHSIQQNESNHCISCREPVIQIYKNDRFPKHPKKADYEFISASIEIRIKHNIKHYGELRTEWTQDFMDRLRAFGVKYSDDKDTYRNVMDNLDGYFYKDRIKLDADTPSYWETVDVVKTPKPLEEFSNRFGTHIKQPTYSFGASMWFYPDKSANFSIRSDEVDFDFFKVHSTHIYSKNGMDYLKNMQKVYKWDGALIFPFRHFKDKRECTIFRNEMARYVVNNESKFPDYLINQASKIDTNMDINKHMPEFLI